MVNAGLFDEREMQSTVKKIYEIEGEIDEEYAKKAEEFNKKKILELRYRQMCQGLKLSIYPRPR
jgi:hypothetical protein